MRVFRPLQAPGDFDYRLVNILKNLNDYLSQVDKGFAKIQRGELPISGGGPLGVDDHGKLKGLVPIFSGTTIVDANDDHSQYPFIYGRTGGQLIIGDPKLTNVGTDVGLTLRAFNGDQNDVAGPAQFSLLDMAAKLTANNFLIASQGLSVGALFNIGINFVTFALTGAQSIVPAGSTDQFFMLATNTVDTAYGANKDDAIFRRLSTRTTGNFLIFEQSNSIGGARVTLSSVRKSDGAWVGPIVASGTDTHLDSIFTIADETTAFTLMFQLSGLTANRVLTVPNVTATILATQGTSAGQVIGTGTYTGGTASSLVIEGPVMLGNNLSGQNFSAGTGLYVRHTLTSNSPMVDVVVDVAGLTGAASSTINFMRIQSVGTIGLTSGTTTLNGLIFQPAATGPPSGVTFTALNAISAIVSLSSTATGTLTTQNGLYVELRSASSSGPTAQTTINGVFSSPAARATAITIALVTGFNVGKAVSSTYAATGGGVLTDFVAYEVTSTAGASSVFSNWSGLRIPSISGPGTIWGLNITGTMNNRIAGKLGLGSTTAPAHWLDIAAGTTTVAPIRLASATPITSPVAGCLEFLTDDFFATITTGAARKAFVLDDGTRLTSGRVPFATTNGRLIDDSDMTFATDTLTVTKLIASTNLTVGAGAAITELERTASGTYTPTLFNDTNISASTAYQCQYLRVGNTVTVSGRVDVDPTAGGTTQLGISLPIASNFGGSEDCAGNAFASAVVEGAAIVADTTNDRAAMLWVPVSISNHDLWFTFTYQII